MFATPAHVHRGGVAEPDSGEEGDAENVPANEEEEDRMLSVSAVSKRAWNHCLVCKLRPGSCVFPLCKQVRPYIDHIMGLRQTGEAIPCAVGPSACKYCNFYSTLKARIELDSANDRKANKMLLVLFVGLLSAHKGDENKEDFKALLDHVLKCRDRECEHQVAVGSCRVSQQLLLHLKECKAKQTKQCPLCNLLPANLRRLKQAPRSLPVSYLVKEEIHEQRLERAKARRRERGRNKSKSSSTTTITHETCGATAALPAMAMDTEDVVMARMGDTPPPHTPASALLPPPLSSPAQEVNEMHRIGLFFEEEPNLQSRLNIVGNKRKFEDREMIGQLKRLKLEPPHQY